jgi:hypothetical protein
MAKKSLKNKKVTSTPASVTRSVAEHHAQVARVAYVLYEQRGAEHGRDLEDWFSAERLVQETLPEILLYQRR